MKRRDAHSNGRGARGLALLLLVPGVLFTCGRGLAGEPEPIRHQVTGLFSTDRVQDLQEVFRNLPQFKLLRVDFDRAEAHFVYDPRAVFPGAKPEDVIDRFDRLLRTETRSTFGIKPLCTTPDDQLELIEIRVKGLDCKGCALGAYEAIYRIDGVERATVSFRDGIVKAWVHPGKTTRQELEDALKKKRVTLDSP